MRVLLHYDTNGDVMAFVDGPVTELFHVDENCGPAGSINDDRVVPGTPSTIMVDPERFDAILNGANPAEELRARLRAPTEATSQH